ncbi:MAG: 3-methyl-2-oxobutanoate hydroxymethyltransferase [Pyrinomonadaceae bacterium]|nr:3-methyl-2-oxobutanoate hydroxymethyltransferase [Phycisphaerales bacterium]
MRPQSHHNGSSLPHSQRKPDAGISGDGASIGGGPPQGSPQGLSASAQTISSIPPTPSPNPAPVPERVTLQTLQRLARLRTPFACLTCYDYTTARWLARGGVHVLLVGDTAAEVILGHTRTIDMSLEVLLALTAAVKRGAPNAVVMGDMPFMSYQADEAEGVRNAGRFLTEGLADIVKVEADVTFAPLVAKMVRAGVPVCGHVGSRPQRAALSGGYGAAGRTAAEASRIVQDAVAMQEAGCQMLLIEAVPEEVTSAVLAATTVPVIGIGAGPACHGQVLVLQDLLGLSEHAPRFAEPVAQLGSTIEQAAGEWVARVAARNIGGKPYGMKAGEAARFAPGQS